MSLGLNLTGLSNGMPIPGIYIEVAFGAGSAAGDLSVKNALLIAPSTSAGTIVQDTEVYGPISGVDEAELKGGPGSPLHRMALHWFKVNKNTPVYLLAPTRSAGVAATLTVTVSGTATGAGVVAVNICEESCEAAYVAGDTPTIIALALSNAINQKTHLPITSSPNVGAVAMTAKVAGPEGNALRAVTTVTSGTTVAITGTTEQAFASGATAASLTAALATIAGQSFSLIIPHTHTGSGTDAQLAALVTQVNGQALPSVGRRQKVLAGTALAASTSVTLAQSINKPRLDIVNLEESPLEPSVLAAINGAVQANKYFSNPASNLDGYGPGANDIYPVLAPRNKGSFFTETEQTIMLQGGVTPIAVTSTGNPYIVRQVTSYSLNGATPDYRVRDSHRVWVADWFADTAKAAYASAGYKWICDDLPNDVQPPAGFATPKRIKTLLEIVVTTGADLGYLDPAKKAQTMAEMAVGLDPTNATRMNERCPVYSVNLLHQHASLFSESSAAA